MTKGSRSQNQLMPQFAHEPQAQLTYEGHTYNLPYSLVSQLRRSITVNSGTTHFNDMAQLAKVILHLGNEMGKDAANRRITVQAGKGVLGIRDGS